MKLTGPNTSLVVQRFCVCFLCLILLVTVVQVTNSTLPADHRVVVAAFGKAPRLEADVNVAGDPELLLHVNGYSFGAGRRVDRAGHGQRDDADDEKLQQPPMHPR